MRSHPENGSGEINIMRIGRILGAVILVLSLGVTGYADEANAEYKHGVKAESTNNFDEAFQAYSKAHSLKPKDARYFTAFTRLRFYAATEHLRKGQSLRDMGKLQEAVVEFQRAAEIDPTNFTANLLLSTKPHRKPLVR
jgi:general secretion pathway protein D